MPEQDISNNDVNVLSVAYKDMATHWGLLNDLMGGTTAMREAEETWLPREPNEERPAYIARLGRSFLFNGYRDTVEKLAGRPFSKPVTIMGELPDQISDMEKDVDRSKRDITQFAKDLLQSGLQYGLAHIFVDFPKVEQPEKTTLADQKALKLRPVFIKVDASQVIGWRSKASDNGEEVVVQVRFKETKVEPDGAFGDKIEKYIRVLNETTWELWKNDPSKEEPDKDRYVKVSEGNHTFGAVPWVTFYLTRTGTMTASPPLEELAWTNLCHWQSYSDQRSILRMARFGILFGHGFTDEEAAKGFTIGPSRMILSSGEHASLEYVEHTGAAIKSGETDLAQLEEKMEILGMDPLVEGTGTQTATAKGIDESKEQSALQSWVRGLESAMEDAFKLAAKWVGEDVPKDFSIDINNDFGISLRGAQDYATLLAMRQAGELTRLTFLTEMKRRGLLADSVDPKTEADAIELEGPPLGSIGDPTLSPEEQAAAAAAKKSALAGKIPSVPLPKI